MADYEYAPEWAKEVSAEELLREVQRRLSYRQAGWQESYRSAQYWRQRAADAERDPKGDGDIDR